MTIAYGCVLFIIIFPYFFTALAKTGKQFNNHDPRSYLDNLTGWRKRAHNVQLNSFEAIPVFGLSVIIAHLTHSDQFMLDMLAVMFVITRIIYAICYLTDQAGLRTLVWMLGSICVIAMYCIH